MRDGGFCCSVHIITNADRVQEEKVSHLKKFFGAAETANHRGEPLPKKIVLIF